MALFFDADWFDARLQALGLSQGDVATALGLTAEQIRDLWKDQRELRAQDVRLLAALLGARPAEVAERAGISTPIPREQPDELAALSARMERIEALLLEIRDFLRNRAANR
jgi:transcriptional regulator with XRE-family HTH domain